MTPEQATFLANVYLPSIKQETQTSRKVIAAVPKDKGDYKPHPNSRSALELAWHIAATDIWFLDGLAQRSFEMSGGEMPVEIKTSADVVAWYDKQLPLSLKKVESLSGEQLAKPISFFDIYNHPAVVYLQFLIVHSVHHRGQLAAYLRPMGAKVPSIYGGSFDEPFEMTAKA